MENANSLITGDSSLRIVLDNAVVFVPISSETTFGDVARKVRGVSAQRRSCASAIAIMFADDRIIDCSASARGHELPQAFSTNTASRMFRQKLDT